MFSNLGSDPALWNDDVREQLCGRRATLLVLGYHSMADVTMDKVVCAARINRIQTYTNNSARKQILNPRLLALSSLVVLIAMRIARRWNQTGQKFAGESDIARTFLFSHRLTLWVLVGVTYLWNIQSLANKGFSRFPQIAAGAIATSLATASITFKLAFTNEDSPELLAGLAKAMAATDSELGISLVTRARIVFMAISLALLYTIASSFGHTKRPNRT
jgi:ethanolaminephosphotransferase